MTLKVNRGYVWVTCPEASGRVLKRRRVFLALAQIHRHFLLPLFIDDRAMTNLFFWAALGKMFSLVHRRSPCEDRFLFLQTCSSRVRHPVSPTRHKELFIFYLCDQSDVWWSQREFSLVFFISLGWNRGFFLSAPESRMSMFDRSWGWAYDCLMLASRWWWWWWRFLLSLLINNLSIHYSIVIFFCNSFICY